MFKIEVENHKSEKITLTNSPLYKIHSIEGLLAPTVTVSTVTATNKDGSEPTNVRAEDRIITINLMPQAPVEANRQKLYNYFPLKKEVTFYFKNGARDVKIKGIVENLDGSLFEMKQIIAINLRCCNPYFENKYSNVVQVSQVISNFQFPFAIEEEGIEFSYINRELAQIIQNAGDIETGLTIELEAVGTVTNPVLYNVDTRESFGLNIEMQAGDLIRINTNVGTKKVELIRNGETTNIINYIAAGNTWLKLDIGENTFTYACDAGEENLYINFFYNAMFIGV